MYSSKPKAYSVLKTPSDLVRKYVLLYCGFSLDPNQNRATVAATTRKSMCFSFPESGSAGRTFSVALPEHMLPRSDERGRRFVAPGELLGDNGIGGSSSRSSESGHDGDRGAALNYWLRR